LVEGSDKILHAITNNIPFKVVNLENIRLEQNTGYGGKLRVNLNLLCKGLTLSSSIKSLTFRECLFDSAPVESAQCLGRLLQTHPTLEYINLGNTLYSEGFEYFFAGLIHNTTLKRLDMRHIDVSEIASVTLREALRVNKTLEELNLAGSKFATFKALDNVVDAIGLSTSLKKLSLSHVKNRSADDDDEEIVTQSATSGDQTLELPMKRKSNFEQEGEPLKKKHKIENSNTNRKDAHEEDKEVRHDRSIEHKLRDALIRNKSLSQLNLSLSEIFPVFGEILERNQSLTSLEFSECDIASVFAVQEISNALKINKTLCSFTSYGCYGLADIWQETKFDALTLNTTLTKLGLGGDSLSIEASESLLEALKHNTTLQSLDLSACDLAEEQCCQLREFLSTNHSLTELEIFGSIDLAQGMFEPLLVNTSLRRLEFGGNRLSVDESQRLSEMLQANHSLQYLRLSDTAIDDNDASWIAAGLRMNCGLTALDMSYNHISARGMKEICNSLLTHPTLQEFVFTTFECDNEGAFGKLLKVNTTLENLFLDGGPMNIPAMEHLCNGLKINTTLRTLMTTQYCDVPDTEIPACRKLLADTLLLNESVTSYDGSSVRVVDGIEPLIAKNVTLRRERITNMLLISHNFIRVNFEQTNNYLPNEVWQHIFSYVKYPGIRFNFGTMFQSVVNKYKIP